jgi:hypothetical protein
MRYICLIFLVLITISCREDFAFTKEKFFADPAVKKWMVNASKYKEMDFVNTRGEKIKFSLNYEREEFSFQKTTIAGIPTRYDEYERLTQFYNSDRFSFGIVLTAYDQIGNLLSVSLGRLNAILNIAKLEIFSLSYGNQNFTNPNNGGGPNVLFTKSILRLASDFKVGEVSMPEVLILEVKDGTFTDVDVDKIVLAQQTGLVYFRYKDGTEFWRVNL